MHKKIYFRADGSSNIGLGHLVRCAALASMLKDSFLIVFVCIEIPENIKVQFIEQGFQVLKIENEDNFISVLLENDIVVVDHYGIYVETHTKIRNIGTKLVCIDDLHDKEFDADLIINHAPGVSEKDYHCRRYTRFALGLDFVLLRKNFLEIAKQNRNVTKIESYFVCFGGSDPLNFTQKILLVLKDFNLNSKVNVVVGAAYPFREKLILICNLMPNVKLFYNISEAQIIELMLESDLAIVPSSGILFEALAVGCKTVSSYYVENQKNIFEGFKKINALIPLENFDCFTVQFLDSISKSNIKLKKVIDGQSGDRYLELFSKL